MRNCLALFISITLFACTYEKGDLPIPVVNCDTTNITYSATIEPIITTYCAITLNGDNVCHASGTIYGTNYEFTTYTKVKAKVDAGTFRQRVLIEKSMPPPNAEPLSACDLQKIQVWVDMGAPNN